MPKKSKKKSSKTSSKQEATDPASVAVYVVLGLLVIGTSFYTGYLVGQSADGGTTTRTGSAAQELTIIEYSDFQCPFCQRAVPTVKQLKENYPGVEVVYKHFPLESIHPDAFNAAVAAECVEQNHGEDAFWEYHDVLFANQQALDTASLKRYAQDLGYPVDGCIDGQETSSIVRADMAEGRQRGVSGTPSFWIQDELIVGAQPYATIAAKVDQKMEGGTPAPAAPAQPSQPQQEQRADVPEGRYSLGDDDAPVVLIEFVDYQCPFCKRHHDQTHDQIVSEYVETGKVRLNMKHFPLPIHPDAQKASEAAECVGEYGSEETFWEYHDALFANQNDLSVASLKQYAQNLGVDISSCLDSGEMAGAVQEDMQQGQQAGIRGTPGFLVNGRPVVGAQPYSTFKTAFDAELAG